MKAAMCCPMVLGAASAGGVCVAIAMPMFSEDLSPKEPEGMSGSVGALVCPSREICRPCELELLLLILIGLDIDDSRTQFHTLHITKQPNVSAVTSSRERSHFAKNEGWTEGT